MIQIITKEWTLKELSCLNPDDKVYFYYLEIIRWLIICLLFPMQLSLFCLEIFVAKQSQSMAKNFVLSCLLTKFVSYDLISLLINMSVI